MCSRTSCGDEPEEVHDVVGLAGEALAELGILRGDADRAGVEVADPHHDAAQHHQRRGREAVLLAAEQRGDDHVATGLHLAVDLDDDAVAELVAAPATCCVSASPSSHGTPPCLIEVRGEAPVPPS